MVKWSSGRVNARVQGFWGWPQRPLSDSAGVRVGPAVLAFGFCLLAFDLALAGWHGVYDDAPISLHITPSKKVYQVGDTFRLSITATNTSDRALLIKKDWKEQLVFYHLRTQDMPGKPGLYRASERSGGLSRFSRVQTEQIEWPGQVLVATWLDSSDVVRLKPGESYTVKRDVRVWTSDDVARFPFRLKLVGIKDYGRKFDTWQGIAWSNPITLTVKPKQ